MQKYGQMANAAVEKHFTCIICGEGAGFNWSDQNGEGMCNKCGTPYQLLEGGKKIEPKLNIKEDWIPVLKQYWNETHKYMGLGVILVAPRDYPECVEGQTKFYEWLDKHPEVGDIIKGGKVK